MTNNKKLKNQQREQIVTAVQDLAYSSGPLESNLPLHRVEELKQQMAPADFYNALRAAALNLIEKNLVSNLSPLLKIEPKLTSEPEVLTQVKKYIDKAVSNGQETEQLQKLFNLG